MFKKTFLSLLGILFVFLFSTMVWALDFNPGKYEITSKVEMPGMPAGSVPPQTITQCVTEQDPVPKNDASGQECEIKDMNQTGNTITWEMECTQQGQKITSQGQMTYSGDSFQGDITTKMGPHAGNMTITTTISGKRIGDCQGTE